MQFLYHKDAGAEELRLEGEEFNYLCRVRRFGVGKAVFLRNLKDGILYRYEILEVGKKSMLLGRLDSETSESGAISESSISESGRDSRLHLLWAVIDPKVIEKSLPMLNELGVAKITFFYAQYSQHSFKPNLPRMEKILIQSCQQCGRASLMELEILPSFQAVCEAYGGFSVFDFGGEDIRAALRGALNRDCGRLDSEISKSCLTSCVDLASTWRVMVGAEGGFSPKERESFTRILSLPNAGILRSESACIFLASIARMI